MISVALAAFASIVAGNDPAGPLGRTTGAGDVPPAQSSSVFGDAFLAMLVAGLETATATAVSDASGQKQSTTEEDASGLQPSGGRAGPPPKAKSRDQVNELACAASPVVPEPLVPAVTCGPEIAIHLSPAKISDKQAQDPTLMEDPGGTRRAGLPPTRLFADERGALENATSSVAPHLQIAFEALVRAPNAKDAGNDGTAAVPLTSEAASPAVISVAGSTPPESVSAGHSAPAASQPIVRSESGSLSDRLTLASEPGPTTERPATGEESHDGEPHQDSPDQQKHADQSPIGIIRPETPLILNAPAAPVAEPVSSASPKPPPAEASTAYPAAHEVTATGGPVSAARDISLQVPNPGGPRVEVHITDRAGAVHVVVRTDDNGLTRDLRNSLPELTQKMNQQGMDVDAWRPVDLHGAAAGHENRGRSQEQSDGRAWSGDSQQGSAGNRHGGRRQSQSESSDEEFDQSFVNAYGGAASWQPVR